MDQGQAAAGMDRLPWLADEPAPVAPKRGNRAVAGWASSAIVAVAAVSYWIGANSWTEPQPEIRPSRPAVSAPLPQPRAIEPAQPQVTLDPEPSVSLPAQRDVSIPQPRAERADRAQRKARIEPTRVESDAVVSLSAPVTAPPAKAVPAPLTAWPATRSAGASGRIVRVGAFASRKQAKLGWRRMVGAYPAMANLQATVVGSRNSRGRHFYRFQIGTTSQAHSEVLCQRIQRIGLSCAVVGLPWKPGGVER